MPEYRREGIKAYDQFIALFPQSTLAPKALNGKGAHPARAGPVRCGREDVRRAGRQVPAVGRGQERAVLPGPQRHGDQAVRPGQVGLRQDDEPTGAATRPDEFARIGQMMLDARAVPGGHPGVPAGGHGHAQERALLERSLYGLGRAALRAEEATPRRSRPLEDLMTRYPKSGLVLRRQVHARRRATGSSAD